MVWRRVLWTIQLVVFVTAGFFVTPVAGRVQNATDQPVASAAHVAERVVASRERSSEHASRIRSDERGGALAFTPPGRVVIAPATSGFTPALTRFEHAPRPIRFEPYAPRGPPQQG